MRVKHSWQNQSSLRPSKWLVYFHVFSVLLHSSFDTSPVIIASMRKTEVHFDEKGHRKCCMSVNSYHLKAIKTFMTCSNLYGDGYIPFGFFLKSKFTGTQIALLNLS